MAETQKPQNHKLVPDFAVEDAESPEWGQLTQPNPDYEKLWSAEAWKPPPEAPAPRPAEKPANPPPARTKKAAEERRAAITEVQTPGFQGTLVTGDEVLTASMVVGPEIIVLWGGGHEIGSWSHEEAKLARLTYSRFAIQAEGDTLTFTADDPTGLDEAISTALLALGPGLGTLPSEPETETPTRQETGPQPEEPAPLAPPPEPEAAVAVQPSPDPEPEVVEPDPIPPAPEPRETRRARIKNFQPAGDTPTPADVAIASAAEADIALPEGEEFGTIADAVRKGGLHGVRARRFSLTPQAVLIRVGIFLIIVAIVSSLIYLALLIGGQINGERATTTTAAAPRTTGVPVVITSPTPSTTPTTAPVPMTTLFATDISDLVTRWNTLASNLETPLLLPPDLASPFFLLLGPAMTLEGVLDPDVGNVTLRATPTGTAEGDGSIITALGLLIATADPTLDGNDRRALLDQLGLDVGDPELAGLDGTLTYNGLLYRLFYDQPSNTLTLSVTPDVPTTTVTTATN